MSPGPTSSKTDAGTCTQSTHIHHIHTWSATQITGRHSEHSHEHRQHQQPHAAPLSGLLVPIASHHCALTLRGTQALSHAELAGTPTVMGLGVPWQGIIWASPPAIVSLSSSVGVQMSLYHIT